MNAIEYRHVSMCYDGKEIIRDLNLSIEKGEFVTLIGSSGCGKTTILKMANGLLMPAGGSVLVPVFGAGHGHEYAGDHKI